MDFINLRDEEYFERFEQDIFMDSCPDDSTDFMLEDKNMWGWEEREINGDIAFIPLTTKNLESDVGDLSTSPPSKDHFHRILCDWQQLLNVDVPVVESFADAYLPESDVSPDIQECNAFKDSNFDIAQFINEPLPQSNISNVDVCLGQGPKPPVIRKVPTGGKKIDLEAQCYVINDAEDDHVDVETVSENGSPAVLEAGDVDSLLAQFEASEEFRNANFDVANINLFDEIDHPPSNTEVENTSSPIIPCKEEVFQTPSVLPNPTTTQAKAAKETVELKETKTKPDLSLPTLEMTASDSSKSKQILDALPKELIKRIKESGKRKTISVIPPIPNKKRCGSVRNPEVGNQITRTKILQMVSSEAVQLDHDYCSSPSPYPKYPKKDSGFESAEEDERAILRNQPTVKNADGKLMVSLLKANTIKPNIEVKQKRKLNLAEYKKRKDIVVPKTEKNEAKDDKMEIEDENTRRIKHQEKLMKMALELLNTPAKNSKPDLPKPRPTVTPTPVLPVMVQPEKPLLDMDVLTLVSVGINTDNSEICTVPVVEEIKPLLQNAKISTNSLINSVIENIPKVKNKIKLDKPIQANTTDEHGENKTIVYLPKNRKKPSTCDVAIQTVEKVEKQRRSISPSSRSSSSSGSRRYHRKRSSSRSSRYSSTGSYSVCSSSSSRSSSRSRSRSISPWRENKRQQSLEREHIQEVEERRVIYVGRISPTTTREDLRRRFQSFGPITRVTVHFRERGDNYGFVTFLNKLDAYEAKERGNDDPLYPKYDLSFGGRRMFCKTNYSDLDNMREEIGYYPRPAQEDSFDNLLRIAQEKLRKRKL